LQQKSSDHLPIYFRLPIHTPAVDQWASTAPNFRFAKSAFAARKDAFTAAVGESISTMVVDTESLDDRANGFSKCMFDAGVQVGVFLPVRQPKTVFKKPAPWGPDCRNAKRARRQAERLLTRELKRRHPRQARLKLYQAQLKAAQ